MYLYLYDSFLNNKKYNSLLARIETRLTDLGIGGKIFRLSPLRDIKRALSEEIQNGIKTAVIVGNDRTLTEIINLAAKLNITLGIIPAGGNNQIAKALGIPSAEEACDILAARIIKKVDLGKANNTYFLSNATVSGDKITINCENKYKVTARKKDQICICNLRPLFAAELGESNYFNPQDGLMEIFIQPIASGFLNFFKKSAQIKNSIIPFKKLTIKGRDSVSVTTDGQKVLKAPVEVEIIPKKLKIIVGKKRMF